MFAYIFILKCSAMKWRLKLIYRVIVFNFNLFFTICLFVYRIIMSSLSDIESKLGEVSIKLLTAN